MKIPTWAGKFYALAPKGLRDTVLLRAVGFLKIPLLNYVKPKVLELNADKMILQIPLLKRNKNHLGSMYFAALSAGADAAVGILALYHIIRSKKPVVLIFKDFHAQFLKRAEDDVTFVCEQGKQIENLVSKAIESGERVEEKIEAKAFVPTKFAEQPVALLSLTLSLKMKTG